jgi:hypothetical protein
MVGRAKRGPQCRAVSNCRSAGAATRRKDGSRCISTFTRSMPAPISPRPARYPTKNGATAAHECRSCGVDPFPASDVAWGLPECGLFLLCVGGNWYAIINVPTIVLGLLHQRVRTTPPPIVSCGECASTPAAVAACPRCNNTPAPVAASGSRNAPAPVPTVRGPRVARSANAPPLGSCGGYAATSAQVRTAPAPVPTARGPPIDSCGGYAATSANASPIGNCGEYAATSANPPPIGNCGKHAATSASVPPIGSCGECAGSKWCAGSMTACGFTIRGSVPFSVPFCVASFW